MKTNQNFYIGRSLPVILAVFIAGIFTANAQPTFKWTGHVDTLWSNHSNWDSSGVTPTNPPTSADAVVIDNSNYTGVGADPTLDGSNLSALTLSIDNAAILYGTTGAVLNVSGLVNGTGTLIPRTATIKIGGNMDVVNFVDGKSSIIMDGSSQSILILYEFYNLTIASGVTTIASGMQIDHAFVIDYGAEFVPIAGYDVSGVGSMSGAGTIDVSDHTATVDNFSTQYALSGGVTLTNLIVKYTGSGPQQIGTRTFGFITIANTSTGTGSGVSLIGTVTIGKSLLLSQGALNAGYHYLYVGDSILGTGANFAAGTGQVFLNGSVHQAVVGITFNDLTVNNTSGNVTLISGPSTVGDSLSMTSGILFTNASNKLMLSSAAIPVTMANTTKTNTSYIDGPAENTGLNGTNSSFLFPEGNLGKYAPIAISNIASAASITAQYFKSQHTASTSSISGTATASSVEYWTMTENSGSSAGSVTLYWLDGTFSGITTPSDLSVYFDPNTGTWQDLGGTASGTASSGFITASASATDLAANPGYYTFGDNSGINPLPVSMTNFTAAYMDDQVNLNWATASEYNNAYFEIERSNDAQNWIAIGQVPGHGTTDQYNSYTAVDNLEGVVPQGIFYYRLKQVDNNGAFQYSEIRSVNVANSSPSVSAYPNPTRNILNVNWTSSSNDNVTLRLTSMTGVSVYQQNVSGIGNIQKQIDLSGFADGVYYLQIISADNKVVNQAIYKN